jgi:H+/Cl- antiporter ClcA
MDKLQQYPKSSTTAMTSLQPLARKDCAFQLVCVCACVCVCMCVCTCIASSHSLLKLNLLVLVRAGLVLLLLLLLLLIVSELVGSGASLVPSAMTTSCVQALSK